MSALSSRTATKKVAPKTGKVARPAVVSSEVPKYTTISELEKNTVGSVYVINSSPRTHRGDVLFSAPKVHGTGVDAIRVVKTWIPQDLTEQVTRQQLLNSSEFRRTVNNGLITLVSAAYAETVLRQSDAQEERQRIQTLRSASQAILKASPLTKDIDDGREGETPTQRRRRENMQKANEENQRSDEPEPASSFQILLGSLAHKTETEILNALRNEGKLTKKELRQTAAAFPDHKRVQSFVQKKLEAM